MSDIVGIAVRNQNRILQIDGEYQNHELVYKAEYTVPDWDSTNDMWGGFIDVIVPPNRENVVMAIKTLAPSGLYTIKISNTSYRIYRGSTNPLSGGIPVTVYFFATPIENNQPGGIGIVVRSRTSGKIVFNSNYRYLRILQFAPVDLYVPQNAQDPPSTATFSFVDKTVAIVQCVRPNGRRQTPGGTPQQPISIFGFFSGTMRTDGAGTATITHRVISSAIGPWGSSVASQTFGTYMIIDVTGY